MNTNEIINKLGITLNEMQREAVNAIATTADDVVVLSPTGSGKTYAYLIPLAAKIDADSDELQVVVLAPGRELALQSCDVLKNMHVGLRAMALYGGRPTMDEHRVMRATRPQIVFATPGRLNDHIAKGNFNPSDVRVLVIDEFDKMLEMGFEDEMSRIIGNLPNVRRHILLSATVAESIPSYLRLGARPVVVNFLSDTDEQEKKIGIFEVDSPEKDKLDTLRRLLLSLGQESSVVFLNYRDAVERTAEYLSSNAFTVSMLHGGLEQKDRERSLYRFANGSAPVLVCTDLASRGLDIPDIANIIHYHIPETEENYIHRVGRTARWDKTGRTFFILSPGEKIPDYVEGDVDKYVIDDDAVANAVAPQPRMSTVYIGKGKKDKISKGDIVGFLCKKGGLRGSEIGRIDVHDRYSYAAVPREKLRQVLRMTRNEKIKGIKTVVEEVK